MQAELLKRKSQQLHSETFDWQFIFRVFELLPTVLTSVNAPASHASVEMHTNLIISPHDDSLLCWLVRCLLCQSVQVVCFFFFLSSHSPLEHSSLVGEQHRATGCASWGGSGCAEEHLWYGLPEGGQTRTSTSQWYVCPSRLLQQYVYTTWWFFFFFSTIPSRFMGSQLWWRSTFECFKKCFKKPIFFSL